MESNKSMSVEARRTAFGHAFRGLAQVFGKEPNAKIHLFAAAAVIIAGIVFQITPGKWIALSIAIGFVLVTEILNTCIEKLCDYACDKEHHPEIKIIKDMAAGAVLVSAVASVAVGVFVFLF